MLGDQRCRDFPAGVAQTNSMFYLKYRVVCVLASS